MLLAHEAEVPELRRSPRSIRVHDSRFVVVVTAPAGADKHHHCALIDANGVGLTSPGANGHVHAVRGCSALLSDGHTHDFSAQRCSREHDRDVRHVDGR